MSGKLVADVCHGLIGLLLVVVLVLLASQVVGCKTTEAMVTLNSYDVQVSSNGADPLPDISTEVDLGVSMFDIQIREQLQLDSQLSTSCLRVSWGKVFASVCYVCSWGDEPGCSINAPGVNVEP